MIRLDTFSKVTTYLTGILISYWMIFQTVAPGSRLGWFTCNPMFAERFERQGETSTQAPCGFGQSMVTQLLVKTWGLSGYVRWLRGLRAQYSMRRDAFVDAMVDEFHITFGAGKGRLEGATVYQCNLKKAGVLGSFSEKAKPVISFVPPTSGMFVWVGIFKLFFVGLPKGSRLTMLFRR